MLLKTRTKGIGIGAPFLRKSIGYREYLRQEVGRFLTVAVNGGAVQENDAVTPLSVMYEILRSWKIPEMYEHHGIYIRNGVSLCICVDNMYAYFLVNT